MSLTQILFILSFLSLTVTTVAFPIVLRYALRHQIVDNPNARKLHRKPIPIMGGVAVYAGILVGCLAMSLLVSGASIRWSIMAITVMLGLGIWDDIKDLSAILWASILALQVIISATSTVSLAFMKSVCG